MLLNVVHHISLGPVSNGKIDPRPCHPSVLELAQLHSKFKLAPRERSYMPVFTALKVVMLELRRGAKSVRMSRVVSPMRYTLRLV